jgi:hypothetical protein
MPTHAHSLTHLLISPAHSQRQELINSTAFTLRSPEFRPEYFDELAAGAANVELLLRAFSSLIARGQRKVGQATLASDLKDRLQQIAAPRLGCERSADIVANVVYLLRLDTKLAGMY